MSKKFIMAALAGFLTVGAFAVSADDNQTVDSLTAKDNIRILAIAKSSSNPRLADNLAAAKATTDEGAQAGYYVVKEGQTEGEGSFVSLAEAIKQDVTTDEQGRDVVTLGRFSQGDKVQFGFKKNDKFTATPINVLSSDPSYYAGYNSEGFYQLDFSEMEFDGKIDVLVIGEPLPGSTVTLLLSLAALAVFMGYSRRKQQRAAAQES